MIPAYIDALLQSVQKPARYTGGEPGSILKDKEKVDVHMAFCFPDLYEIGMSHLGMKILYGLLNERKDTWCERVFAPDVDMENAMKAQQVPLFSLESFTPLSAFDIVAFTLQYELSYPAILNMLHLGGIPLRAAQRDALAPLVIGGGPCACNPEPLSDFFDLFVLGEGEEVIGEVVDAYKKAKQQGISRAAFLQQAAQLKGVYVPSLYTVAYNEDKTVGAITPLDGAPQKVQKRIVQDLNGVYFPRRLVVPLTEAVHDRVMTEVLRGCIRGCRFCQAGFIYRPYREKEPDMISADAKALCASTGYDEVSLTSLSTGDHSGLDELFGQLLTWTDQEKVNISLPSLRLDSLSPQMVAYVKRVRQSSLTFAPEAGTQRMRDVINKNLTDEAILKSCRTAFEGGYTSVKLYFMLGLPTETEEDVKGIVELAQRIVDLYYALPGRPKGKAVQVTISAACFVPKPFTPFQYEPQDTRETFKEKQKLLLQSATSRKIKINYHDATASILEAVLARGDRRLCAVLEEVWRHGARMDSWDEHLSPERWHNAFATCGVDPAFYAHRRRSYEEILPWSHLDYGITEAFLQREHQTALAGCATPNCRDHCAGCAANQLIGGNCFD